jgi:hypothetical protein
MSHHHTHVTSSHTCHIITRIPVDQDSEEGVGQQMRANPPQDARLEDGGQVSDPVVVGLKP